MQCCIVLSSWMQLSSWVNNRAAHWSQEVMSWAELQWQPLRKKKYGSVGWSQEASENWVTGALTDRKPPLKPGSDLTLLCTALPFQNKHWDRIWIPTILWICCREGATHWLRIWKLILKVVYYACCAAPWVALHDSQLKMMLFIFAVHPLSETSFLSFFFRALFSFLFFFWLVAPQKFVQLVGGASHTSRKKTFISCALTSLFLSFICIYGLFTTPGCELWDWLFK